MVAQKERGIIFGAESVLAILSVRKTQTRRVIKSADWYACLTGDCPHDRQCDCDTGMAASAPCKVGQRLWVKETWCNYPMAGNDGAPGLIYKATSTCAKGVPDSMWISPLFMPRWASRITLEVTAVRVERLQEISEKDAKAEGCDMETCAAIFQQASGNMQLQNHCWLTHDARVEDDPASRDFCPKCATKEAKKMGQGWVVDGNMRIANESDGPAYCDGCGNPLLMSITKHGIDSEVMENDNPNNWALSGVNAAIAGMIADGIGDRQPSHEGRLSQMGYATLWNKINGKKHPWKSNPWVWVYEFRRVMK